MADNDKKWLLTPKLQLHVTGQLIPKDIHYRIKFKDRPKYRFTLCMPDGMICSVSVLEGEDPDKKMKDFINNWYKVTKDKPDVFEHFTIKERCPKCGGELRAKIHQDCCSIWCVNYPNCDYQELGNRAKSRNLIFEKHGLPKPTITHKTGTRIVLSNKPIKK